MSTSRLSGNLNKAVHLLLENDDRHPDNAIKFQQDSAIPNYAKSVWQYSDSR